MPTYHFSFSQKNLQTYSEPAFTVYVIQQEFESWCKLLCQNILVLNSLHTASTPPQVLLPKYGVSRLYIVLEISIIDQSYSVASILLTILLQWSLLQKIWKRHEALDDLLTHVYKYALKEHITRSSYWVIFVIRFQNSIYSEIAALGACGWTILLQRLRGCVHTDLHWNEVGASLQVGKRHRNGGDIIGEYRTL